jgi:hypothetical protein
MYGQTVVRTDIVVGQEVLLLKQNVMLKHHLIRKILTVALICLIAGQRILLIKRVFIIPLMEVQIHHQIMFGYIVIILIWKVD